MRTPYEKNVHIAGQSILTARSSAGRLTGRRWIRLAGRRFPGRRRSRPAKFQFRSPSFRISSFLPAGICFALISSRVLSGLLFKGLSEVVFPAMIWGSSRKVPVAIFYLYISQGPCGGVPPGGGRPHSSRVWLSYVSLYFYLAWTLWVSHFSLSQAIDFIRGYGYYFIVPAWQYWVLTRPHIRELFYSEPGRRWRFVDRVATAISRHKSPAGVDGRLGIGGF